uniref:Uncharacterized protein n=1 Tax=Arundo donax TaxID=35708 RepID=A0A0A8ZQ45_ARUDO
MNSMILEDFATYGRKPITPCIVSMVCWGSTSRTLPMVSVTIHTYPSDIIPAAEARAKRREARAGNI